MNGIKGLRPLNGPIPPNQFSGAVVVALPPAGATIGINNTPHASRQIGAPWGVTFFRPSRSAEGIPEFAAPSRDGDAA
ncbi:hypothetical protein GCM10022229_03570 [Luteimonas lutimaris]|uniref:Uncharacterized protein n=1 Tax=Luteimonas lutimaris TaxID=698645 RepID=A0ABP7M5A6_9GAMM